MGSHLLEKSNILANEVQAEAGKTHRAEWFEEMTKNWHNFWGPTYLLPGFNQVLWPYAFALQAEGKYHLAKGFED